MRMKSLAQGENILMLGIEPSKFVSKVDILTTTPIVHNMYHITICIIIRDNATYDGLRVLDIYIYIYICIYKSLNETAIRGLHQWYDVVPLMKTAGVFENSGHYIILYLL